MRTELLPTLPSFRIYQVALSAQDLRRLVVAATWLSLTAVVLRLRGLRACLALFELLERPKARGRVLSSDEVMAEALAMARMIRIAATYGPYRAKCLPRAITLW